MAGTALADYLHLHLEVVTEWCNFETQSSASVVVLLTTHESAATVPRLLSSLSSRDARIIFVYDGSVVHNDLIESAVAFGVWSLCDARDDIAVLEIHVRRALAGESWGHDHVSEMWMRRLANDRQLHLSPRESQVAQAFCGEEELDPPEIAVRLGLSVHTVRVHLVNIRRKIGNRYTGNRAALRSALVENGWVA